MGFCALDRSDLCESAPSQERLNNEQLCSLERNGCPVFECRCTWSPNPLWLSRNRGGNGGDEDPRKSHSNAVREEGLNCPDIKRPKMSGLRTACLPKLESSYAGRTMGMVRRRVSWRKHRICTLLQRLILFL